MKNGCHVPHSSVLGSLRYCHLQALVQAVDPSAEATEPAKPGRAEQGRKNTARSKMLIDAAERVIFKKKNHIGLLFP